LPENSVTGKSPLVDSTVVYRGTGPATSIRIQTLARALSRIDICDDANGTRAIVKVEPIKKTIIDANKNRKITVRFITEISRDNLSACEELIGFVELRHLDGVRGNFVVTENEYYAFTFLEKSDLPSQTIHSDLMPIVEQQQYLFEVLWAQATPATERMDELKHGKIHPKITVIQNPKDTQRTFIELVRSANNQIMFVFPTVNSFRREEMLGVIEMLERKAAAGVKVRILIPREERIEQRIEEGKDKLQDGQLGIEYRRIDRPYMPNTVTILVVDGTSSFVLEQKDDNQEFFTNAVGNSTFSTSKPNVVSQMLFFETLWRESDLRDREAAAREQEERAKERSQLLQDILTHDMRNYNQSMLLDADSLTAVAGDREQVAEVSRSLIRTIERSSALIDRARYLGRIIDQNKVELKPVDLTASVEGAISLIQKTHPEAKLVLSWEGEKAVSVSADELLDEVFSNIVSNAMKYNQPGAAEIPLDVRVEETDDLKMQAERLRPQVPEVFPGPKGNNKPRQRYWKLTFADHGIGIPDDIKKVVFTRYLKTAKGTGLGLSIVHALVVERYKGFIRITDRLPGDSTKGAKVEIWLKRA
jgi:two-component system, OmpR family, sensor histidine kinase VicK